MKVFLRAGLSLALTALTASPVFSQPAAEAPPAIEPAPPSTSEIDKLKKRIKQLEGELKPGEECPGFFIPDGTAETQCPYYVSLNTGAELQRGAKGKNFSEVFPRLGLRARVEGPSINNRNAKTAADFILRPHVVVDMSLTSVLAKDSNDPNNPDDGNVDGERAWSGEGGVLLDVFDFRRLSPTQLAKVEWAQKHESEAAVSYAACEDLPRETDDEKKVRLACREKWGRVSQEVADHLSPTATLALLGEVGAVSADDDRGDLYQRHFAGARLYYRGSGFYNGLSLDVGWGISENFTTHENSRVKFRANFPLRLTRKGDAPVKMFARVEVDSDFGSGDDEIKMSFGVNTDVNRILSALSFGAIGGLPLNETE